MITGTWLTRIGRAFAREETFERMIAPAIADLQLEAHHGRLVTWRHSMGIIAVFIHALLQDLRVEVSLIFSNETRHAAWKRAAVWYVFFVALFTFLGLRYNLPPNMSLNGIWVPAVTSTGLAAVITAVIPGMMAAALYLTRRSSSRLSIVLVTLMVAALTIGFAMAARPYRLSADRILHNRMNQEIAPSSAWSFRDRLDARVSGWRDLQNGVQIIPFALLGILLARRRGLGVAVGVLAYYASWILVVVVTVSLFHSRDPASRVAQGWREVGLNFAALLILFAVDLISRRIPAVTDQTDRLRP